MQGHVHKIVGAWFQEFTDIRDAFTRPSVEFTVAFCKDTVSKLEAAAKATGREHPVPKISARKQARLAREEAISGAKMEQERQDRALAALAKKRAAAALGSGSTGEQGQTAGNAGNGTTRLDTNAASTNRESEQNAAGNTDAFDDVPGSVRKQARVLNSVTV